MPPPLAYFLTWTTYGSWLPGDDRGSVTHARGVGTSKRLEPAPNLRNHARAAIEGNPIAFSLHAREVVGLAIRDHAGRLRWHIHALEVRSNHVHLVITSPHSPERVMTACKACATKVLREEGLFEGDASVWTRHGSTRWLNDPGTLQRAINYTLTQQDNTARFEPYKPRTE